MFKDIIFHCYSINCLKMDNVKISELQPLTDRQFEVLRFLHDYFSENRFMPTRREIASFLELNSLNVSPYLSALEKKGYLVKKGERLRRNLELTQNAYEKLNLSKSSSEK